MINAIIPAIIIINIILFPVNPCESINNIIAAISIHGSMDLPKFIIAR